MGVPVRSLILSTLCCAARASAQDTPAPQPQAPAPAGYRSPDDILARVAELASSGQAQLIPLAKTAEERTLAVAAFGERAVPGRPALLVVADPSGDRPVASQVALALCERLAAGSPLLDAATVYVLPVANPDAAAHAFAGLPAWRGAPVDEDRDGMTDEDPAEDLDGDGLVLQMRVPDPTGEWRSADLGARALVKADRGKGEAGAYRLLPEGRDDDHDRAWNEDGPGGVRWDSNWPHRYPVYSAPAGMYPLSEPETRALAEFVLGHPHIALVIVLGAQDNLSKPPDGGDDRSAHATKPLGEDAQLLALYSERWLKGVSNKPRGGERGGGTFVDWAYFQGGLPVLQSALWSAPLDSKPPAPAADAAAPEGAPQEPSGEPQEGKKEEKKEEKKAEKEEKERSEAEKLLLWNDQVLGGAGFVAWKAHTVPELGQVEIGGWKPLALENPPAGELAGLGEEWMRRLESLHDDFAQLRWDKLEVRALGGGVFEARATLLNSGLLPTETQMGQEVERMRPVRVLLELPEGGALLSGARIQPVERLAGRGGNREFRWLYSLPSGAAAAQVRAASDTAGEAIATLEVNR